MPVATLRRLPPAARPLPRTALLLAVALLPLLASCGAKKPTAKAPPTPEVRVVAVEQKDVPLYREWVGEVLGEQDVEIRARAEGWLEGMHFQEGTMVQKGQLLYTIDPSELRERVAGAEGNLASAQTLLARAKSDVARYRPLAAAGAVSQRELEAAEADMGARQGAVDAARASLNAARLNLGYATVTAPISGLIGMTAARPGDFVGRAPNAVILNTVSRIDQMRVRFSITEQEYLDLARRSNEGERVAQTAEVRLALADGSMYPHPGRVLLAERRVDPATGTLQVETRFPNPQRLLRPGQFGRVHAKFDERKNALVIPARAVTDLQGRKVVWVVGEGDKVEFRVLTPGPQSGHLLVVESGVAAGEKVVVEGMQRLRADMVVKAVPYTPDSTTTPGATQADAPARH